MINKLISVVVPVYNAEKTLHYCVDSILAQTYKHIEILLCDDGSVDSSFAICNEYARKYPFVRALHKENGGCCSARNLGLDNAMGDYFTVVDADDFLEPKCFENMLNSSKQEADLYCINVQTFDLVKGKKGKMATHYSKSYRFDVGCDPNDVIGCDFFSIGFVWSRIFQMSIIKNYKIRFDERLTHNDDHVFFFEYLVYCNTISICSEVGYYWAIRSDSLSHSVHKYKPLLTAGQELLRLLPILSHRFKIRDKKYILKVASEYGLGNYRAAFFSLYYYAVSKSERVKYLVEQTPIMRKLFIKYGYKPNRKKHKLLYIFLCLPIPASLKDILLLRLWKK